MITVLLWLIWLIPVVVLLGGLYVWFNDKHAPKTIDVNPSLLFVYIVLALFPFVNFCVLLYGIWMVYCDNKD